MPTFTYTGEDRDGVAVTETVESDDRYAVYDIARKAGHTVSNIEEGRGGGGLKGLIDIERLEYIMSKVKDDELVMMTRNLASMLVAGLPLTRALSVIQRQSKNPRLIGIVKSLQDRINKGDPYHEALKEHPKVFSDLYTAMVRAGEESGGLADALQTLSMQMERSSSLKKKIKGAMIYPSIVLVVLVMIGVLMMIFVVPSITDTFKSLDVELPGSTQLIITVSDFMSQNALLTILGMFGSVAGFIAALRTKYGKRIFDWVIIRLPVIGTMVKETNAARMGRTLSSLLSSGVDVIGAIKITEDVVQNVHYKEIVAEAAVRVEKGSPLSEVFIERDDLYPVLLGEMILVGEETGNISKMLQEVAVFYETEVEQKTKDLSTIIEPVLMVVIGGTVGFFALAMIAPIYSISDSIG